MAAVTIPFATDDSTSLLDPAGYSAEALLFGSSATDALRAWCMLSLVRLNLANGHHREASLALSYLAHQSMQASLPVAARLRRDLVGLNAALAVARAVCPVSLA